MKEILKGKWSYRSFRHEPIVVKDGQVVGNPELAVPWSPAGVLEVDTDEKGKVTGKLTFTPKLVLDVKGHIVPATDTTPAGIELIGKLHTSVNRIKGFFVPGSDHIVGTILSVADDLLHQPVGTAGPFVLFPIKENGY